MVEQLPCSYSKFISSEIFTLLVGPSLKPFRVHKQLLAEISTELKNHVYNEMKEGLEGSMKMPHVSEETTCQFLEFCYTGRCPEDLSFTRAEVGVEVEDIEPILIDTMPPPRQRGELYERLHPSAKLYVLGDMYNIPRLKKLVFENIRDIFKDIGYAEPIPEKMVDTFVELFKYASENLPERPGRSDPLLEFLGEFVAWRLDSFRENKDFIMLFSNGDMSGFFRQFLKAIRNCEKPPWGERPRSSCERRGRPPPPPPKLALELIYDINQS